MNKERIAYLLERYRSGSISENEQKELLDIIKNDTQGELIPEGIVLDMESVKPIVIDEEKWKPVVDTILEVDRPKKAEIRRMRPWVKWAAAACILLVAGYVLWVTGGGKATRPQGSEATAIHDVPAPNNTRAVITLADGRKVYLDSVGNGTIAQENNVNVVKNNNGEIIYNRPSDVGINSDENPDSYREQGTIAYNTLFNPRGSKVISLTLSDGTKVWLNSESSLRYPASFSALSAFRDVEIAGEAYFEVKHNSKQPFKVHLPNGSIVEDIGTSFNINAYTGENDIKTTLIEGSVRVVGGDANKQRSSVVLKPGQQAAINTFNLQLLTFNSVDLDEVMAWKNGRFQFSGASIETIMKEVSRYYDAPVVYEDKVPGQFVADISRDVPVSKLLQILELTNRVHFKIEGKKITVTK